MKQINFAWFDGKLIKASEARVPLLTHALHYGSGVFEGIRAYETSDGAAIFRLGEHVERLFQSAAAIGIKIPYSGRSIEQAIRKLVAANKFTSCYIRPLVFYGEGQMGLFPAGAKIHVTIAAWPWPAYLDGSKVLSVCLSPYIRLHPKSGAPGAKISGSYATSVMAALDSHGRGFNECIMLDHEGSVAEGPGENIFIVKGKKVLTPNSKSILRGITRDSVMAIARDMGYPASEKRISLRELLSADEAFFTGTAAEVASIGSVDGKKIGTGKVGPITSRIRSTYLAAVHGKVPRYKKWLR